MFHDELNELRVIRQHRQHRIERKLKAQRRLFDELEMRIKQSLQNMETASMQHAEQRKILSRQHQNKKIGVDQLKEWGKQEKRLIDTLNAQHADIEQLKQEREGQLTQLDETRELLRLKRLGLEKLDALQHMIKEEEA